MLIFRGGFYFCDKDWFVLVSWLFGVVSKFPLFRDWFIFFCISFCSLYWLKSELHQKHLEFCFHSLLFYFCHRWGLRAGSRGHLIPCTNACGWGCAQLLSRCQVVLWSHFCNSKLRQAGNGLHLTLEIQLLICRFCTTWSFKASRAALPNCLRPVSEKKPWEKSQSFSCPWHEVQIFQKICLHLGNCSRIMPRIWDLM